MLELYLFPMPSPRTATVYTTRAWVWAVPMPMAGDSHSPLPSHCTWCYWRQPHSRDPLFSPPCLSLFPFSLFPDGFPLVSESLQWLPRAQRTSPSISGDTQHPGWSGPCLLPCFFFPHPASGHQHGASNKRPSFCSPAECIWLWLVSLPSPVYLSILQLLPSYIHNFSHIHVSPMVIISFLKPTIFWTYPIYFYKKEFCRIPVEFATTGR